MDEYSKYFLGLSYLMVKIEMSNTFCLFLLFTNENDEIHNWRCENRIWFLGAVKELDKWKMGVSFLKK